MELKPLCKSVTIGLIASTFSVLVAHASTATTPATPSSANPINKDGTPVPRSDQPANFDHVQNAQARETLTKYGRPHNIPLMTYLTMRAFTGNPNSDMYVTSLQGRWRTTSTSHYHGGMDLGSRGRRDVAYAGVTGKIIKKSGGMTLIDRLLPQGDRVAHVHADRAKSLGIGSQLVGTQLNSPYSYGSPFGAKGTIFGRLSNVGTEHVHDHVEYHVRAKDPRVSVRVYGEVQDNKRIFKLDRTTYRSLSDVDFVSFKQLDPTPYFAYDSELKYKYRYTGGSMFTAYNNVYNTQLPAGLFAPRSERGNAVKGYVQPAKKLPVTLFSGSAYAKLPVTMEQLGSANTAIIDYAESAESAGFAPSGQILTQRMLASHMSDENGETWQSVFGVAEAKDPFGMSQDELVRYLGTKRLYNPDWYKQVVRLSDKGLFTEFMLQRAEINFMYGLLTRLEQEQIKQDAVLSRLMMKHMDKAVETTAETVELRLPPDFAKVHLEKKGDEWVESEVHIGNEYVNSGYSLEEGEYAKFSDEEFGEFPIPASVPESVKPLVAQLAGLISKHEGKSWDAYNTGALEDVKGMSGLERMRRMGCYMESYFDEAGVQRALRKGGMRPTETTMKEIASSGKYKVCPPNPRRLSANGKYQIMYQNIGAYIRQNPHLANEKFTPTMQNRMLIEFFLLGKGNATRDVIMKGTNKENAKTYITKTWASVCYVNKKHGHYKQACHPSNSQLIHGLVDKIAQMHGK